MLTEASSSNRRRWFKRILLGLGAVVLAFLALYGWALLSTDSSTFARALVWREADVGDLERFPARTIPAPGAASPLPAGAEPDLVVPSQDGAPLEEVLGGSDTSAIVVVHRGRLVYERYFEGADAEKLQTSFSVAKSFLAALVGIAIADGSIASVDDPVTDYVPELAERDPRFARISLRDLLTMSSGLRYDESGLPWAGDDTLTYYGVDLREAALEHTEFEGAPGDDWLYNNYNPLLLGLVLERTTGMPVSDYMSARLWRPLGAASDASWSLDSEESGFEKLESGVNATPGDYARFGLLFLNEGRVGSRQVVPASWVRAATSVQTATDHEAGYGYFWWVDPEHPGNYYALGNYGQYVYVAPGADAVFVRLGSDWGLGNDGWLELFRDLGAQLSGSGAPDS